MWLLKAPFTGKEIYLTRDFRLEKKYHELVWEFETKEQAEELRQSYPLSAFIPIQITSISVYKPMKRQISHAVKKKK